MIRRFSDDCEVFIMKYILGVMALFVSILLFVSAAYALPPAAPATPILGGETTNGTNTTTSSNITVNDTDYDLPEDPIPPVITTNTTTGDVVACTMDVKLCADGSYVGRIAPNCSFAPCPDVDEPPLPPVIPINTTPVNITPLPTNTSPVNITPVNITPVNITPLPTNTSPLNVTPTIPGNATPCVIQPEMFRELLSLERQLREKYSEGKDVTELKAKIETINVQIRAQRMACVGLNDTTAEDDHDMPRWNGTRPVTTMPPNAVAVGRTCELSSELKAKIIRASKDYRIAIEAKDFETAKTLREVLSSLEEDAKSEREKCMNTIVPGLVKKNNMTCEVPQGLYDELEKSRYRASEARSLNATVSKDVRERIGALESQIARYKAKCNALNVTKDVNESDVARYYKQRMVEAMDNDDIDSKVQSLKELRSEIDETIKNMLEKKKQLKYSEMEGVTEGMKFKAKNVQIGDSELNNTDIDVEVDTSKNGSNVHIRPGASAVLISQGDHTVNSDNISVNDSGIYVNDLLVKTMPAELFKHNKNLEKYSKRIISTRLAADDGKAVYVAEYTVKKRILAVIPAKANYELTVDAANGETLREKKPWWSLLSTNVREDVTLLESDLIKEETATQ